MQKSAWIKFTKRIPVNADIETIYKAWATGNGLESWFLRKAEFVTAENVLRPPDSPIWKGDSYTWLWHGYDDGSAEKRKVVEANGKDIIRFEFSGDSIVSVNVLVEEGQTIVQLIQEHIPLADDPSSSLYVACGEGWTFYLTNLKSILEGGIDLRNKDVNIKRVINS